MPKDHRFNQLSLDQCLIRHLARYYRRASIEKYRRELALRYPDETGSHVFKKYATPA